MRKTKIVCTIGPATSSYEMIEKLILSGMDVARLNFSHGDYESHKKVIKNIRSISKKLNKPISILQDLSGPKLRLGEVKQEITVSTGDEIILTSDKKDDNSIYFPHPEIFKVLSKGTNILIDDGLLSLKVVEVKKGEIRAKVQNNGKISSHKGVNFPNVTLPISSITSKDKEDLKFGIEQNVDYVAISFVRSKDDVQEIKRIIKNSKSDIPVISKIEKHEAVKNLSSILEESNGIMIARGDLGVEMSIDEVPLIQKKIIKECNKNRKVVITATQMLDSMQRNLRPTRAEVTDVANAIFDGTDAVMLSGETAVGLYPLETLNMMDKIIRKTESSLNYEEILKEKNPYKVQSITDAICHAASEMVLDLKAKAIITSTTSGYTALMVSSYHPQAEIIAVTPDEKVIRRLSLFWGVFPMLVRHFKNTDEMMKEAISGAIRSKLVKKGDIVIITAGVPVGEKGKTNLIKVHRID